MIKILAALLVLGTLTANVHAQSTKADICGSLKQVVGEDLLNRCGNSEGIGERGT